MKPSIDVPMANSSDTDNTEPTLTPAPKVNVADYGTSSTTETDDDPDQKKWARTKRALSKTAMGLTIFMGTATALYAQDVHAVSERLKDTHPIIKTISQPNNPRDAHRMILGISGFGTTNADNPMQGIQYERLGLEASLQYDQRGIDTTVIKNTVLEYAKQHNIDEIVLSGHSMGGDVALEVAALLYEDPHAPQVSDIILDCTPPNLTAVQEDKKRAGDRMLSLTSHIPGHRNSTYLHAAGEMISRYKNYTNPDGHLSDPLSYVDMKKFFDQAMIVKNEKLSDKSGTVGLFIDEYDFIADGIEGSMGRLGKPRQDKRKPHIRFIRPHDAASDTTVSIERAVQLFVESADKNNLDLEVYTLEPGTWHASPGQTPIQYNNLIIRDIIPSIRINYQAIAVSRGASAIAQTPKQSPPQRDIAAGGQPR